MLTEQVALGLLVGQLRKIAQRTAHNPSLLTALGVWLFYWVAIDIGSSSLAILGF
jgi:hypothetical protein